MNSSIEIRQSPEDRELKRKLAELEVLENKLAQRELDLATLQADLKVFEARYLSIVGTRYAELDEIEAKIAEARSNLNPDNKNIKEEAAKARQQADESAQATGRVSESEEKRFVPSDEIKRLFREVAKCIHPDLSTEEKDRVLRQRLMVEANRAYEEGDERKLRSILLEWESSPESVKGEGAGAELVRVIRKAAQIKERLRIIQTKIREIKKSDLFKLKIQVDEADQKGRDLLAEMASHMDIIISQAKTRMEETETKESI